jgi:putative membrane protein
MKHIDLATMMKGCAMGIAEVIPGVSGGTIAFISGIYERLLDAIKSFDLQFFKLLLNGKFKEAWQKADGWFLISLIAGMGVGIIAGVFIIDYFLRNYPEPLWGFFFGLIIASAYFVGKQISQWNFRRILLLFAGFAVAFGITMISPAEGNTSAWYIFISGVIAISALILPGVSGSFMLLLMGMYTLIIPSLKHFLQFRDMQSLGIISVFAVGCLVGLTGFSRVMSWLFNHYKSSTFVVLAGFLIGSLNKIWPWRNVSVYLDKNTNEVVFLDDISVFNALDQKTVRVITEVNVWPHDYIMSSPKTLATVVSLLIGFILVFWFERNSKTSRID